MARLRKVEIVHFRGIKSLTWLPSAGLNCLIGPGDSGPVGRVAACRGQPRRSGERSLARPHPRCGRCTGLADRVRETGRAERRSGMRPPRREYGLDAAESSERSLVVGARERLVRGSSRLPSCNMHYNWRVIVMNETIARAPKPNCCAGPDGRASASSVRSDRGCMLAPCFAEL